MQCHPLRAWINSRNLQEQKDFRDFAFVSMSNVPLWGLVAPRPEWFGRVQPGDVRKRILMQALAYGALDGYDPS